MLTAVARLGRNRRHLAIFTGRCRRTSACRRSRRAAIRVRRRRLRRFDLPSHLDRDDGADRSNRRRRSPTRFCTSVRTTANSTASKPGAAARRAAPHFGPERSAARRLTPRQPFPTGSSISARSTASPHSKHRAAEKPSASRYGKPLTDTDFFNGSPAVHKNRIYIGVENRSRRLRASGCGQPTCQPCGSTSVRVSRRPSSLRRRLRTASFSQATTPAKCSLGAKVVRTEHLHEHLERPNQRPDRQLVADGRQWPRLHRQLQR